MTAPACPCCGEPMRQSETKLQSVSLSCGNCGFQGFAKSPKAVNALRSRQTPAAPVFPDAITAVAPSSKPAKRKADVEVFGE
jgi:predicted  nucleic acid-binding Zn-ribbon protein